MGTAYNTTSPTNFVDGETIEASDFTTEFNAIDATFETGGHQHDGTDGEDGAIEKLLSNTITFGTGVDTDIAVTFNANTADGVLTWMEDEDYFKFSDDVLVDSTEKLYFRDTAIYLNSSTDGQLDLVADTEIQIAATTVDLNGNLDVSGTYTGGGLMTTGGNIVIPDAGNIGSASDTDAIAISSGGVVTMNQIPVFSAGINVSGGTIAGTLATAAQGNVTSLGTLTALTVDDVAVNGKVITMTGSSSDTAVFTAGTNGTLSIVTTDAAAAAANIQITADGTVDIDSAGVLTLDSGAAINIEPASGSAILLDGTISIDAGVVTGATSITSTAFVGDITGDVTGNASGTAATVTTAAQSSITSLGTLTTLTVDNVIINGTTIGHTDDTDLITLADGVVTVAGELDAATLDISGNADIDGTTNLDAVDIDGAVQIDATVTVGANDQGYDIIFYGDTASANMTWDTSADDLIFNGGAGLVVPDSQFSLGSTAITSTGAELNLLDGSSAGSIVNSKAVIYSSGGVVNATDVAVSGSGNRAISITSTDGIASMEIGAAASNAAFIDFKTPSSDDYDLRIASLSGGSGGSITLASGTFSILTSGETAATFADDGAVTLYYDNTAALATKSGGGTLTGTWEVTTALVPDASDGAALGTTALEWSDLFLADGAVINFGDDQDVTLTHNVDRGLTLKNANTGDDSYLVLGLQTGETDIQANDIIAAIDFSAPNEGTGTDANTVAAAIVAISEGDFAADNNATSLSFRTGASGSASEKVKISSAGILTIQGEGSNTTNATQGVAKSWVRATGSGTAAVNDSLNIGSITDNGVGDYTFTLSTNMGNANACLTANSGQATTRSIVDCTTSTFDIDLYDADGGTRGDTGRIFGALHGDLS